MHYVTEMKINLKIQERALTVCKLELDEVIEYLSSDKFKNDPTVQVADMLMRIREVQTNLIENTYC